MSDGHTIIASHLDDKELRASIDNLVEYYRKQLGTMMQITDDSVGAIQKSLRKIEQKGKGKSGSTSSSDAGSSARAKKQQEEVSAAVEKTTEAYKKQNATLDQLAQGFQKVARASSSQGSFLEHIKSQNEQLQKWLTFPQSSSFGIINIKAIEKDLRESEPRIREEIERVKSELESIQKLPFRGGPYGLIQTKRLTAELQEYEAALARISTEEKKATSIEEQRAAAIKKMADEIRNSREWKETGYAWVDGHQFIDATRSAAQTKRERKALGSLEEQIARHMRDQAYAAERAARAEREEAEDAKKNLDARREITAEFQKLRYDAPQVKSVDDESTFRKMVKTALGGKSSFTGASMDMASIEKLQTDLKNLTDAYARLTRVERESPFGKELLDRIAELRLRIKELSQEASKPLALTKIFYMPENSISQISTKVSELRANLNMLDQSTAKGRKEARLVQDEITRLMKKQDDLMGKQAQLFGSNNALARSWNYMKNRLAFYFSVGASTQFVRNLIEVRSQYELTERSLGILINSAERGTQIFQELSQMALISPYTLIELSNAARQLTAYGVESKNLVDTTRRLADISAAVGGSVEQIAYALGHVQSYGHLTSLQARQFANSGIPLVKELARSYTELEGRVVSVSDVYDRMKHKMISYEDVMRVINDMTNEGGRFFDFQAKASETLKVQLANLTLAWNNMLNEMGASNQSLIELPIKGLKELFLAWRDINKVIYDVLIPLGIFKGTQLLLNTIIGKSTVSIVKNKAALTGSTDAAYKRALADANLTKTQAKLLAYTNKNNVQLQKALVNMKLLTAAEMKFASTGNIGMRTLAVAGLALKGALQGIYAAAMSLFTNPAFLAGAGIFVAMEALTTWWQNAEKAEEDTKNLQNSAEESRKELEKFRDTIKSVWDVSDDAKAKKTWEELRNEIEQTTSSGKLLVQTLIQDYDTEKERAEKAKEAIDDLVRAKSALEKSDLKIEQDSWLWGAFGEGLAENVEDVVERLKELRDRQEEVGELRGKAYSEDIIGDVRGNLDSTIDKMLKEMESKMGDISKLSTTAVREYIEGTRNGIIASSPKLQGLGGDVFNLIFDQELMARGIKGYTDGVQTAFNLLIEDMKNRGVKDFDQVTDDLAKSTGKISDGMKASIDKSIDYLKKTMPSQFHNAFNQIQQWAANNAIQLRVRLVTEYAPEGQSGFYKSFIQQFQNPLIIKKSQKDLSFNAIAPKSDQKVNDYIAEQSKAQEEDLKTLANVTRSLKTAKDAAKESLKTEKENLENTIEARKEVAAFYGFTLETDKQRRAAAKAARQEESALTKALREQLSIIEKAENIYKTLTKEGMSHADAVKVASEGWDESLRAINVILKRNGLPKMDMSEFVGLDNPKALKDKLQAQLDVLVKRGAKPAEIKVMQAKIKDLDVEAQTYNLSKLTKSLNSELDKLWDEYELSLALDADPELGGVFADMLKIDTKSLPKDFWDLVNMLNDAIRKALVKDNVVADAFDVMTADMKGDDKGRWKGLSLDSELVRGIIKIQDKLRSTFQKNITSTEKALDDYVKKYGDYSDRIAEIEANRLQRMRDLNNAYNEKMRTSPEYIAKARAIEMGAAREKGAVRFDAFKDSPYYIAMFENLEYLSSSTLKSIRQRLSDIRSELGSLTPEQLKQIVELSEKVDEQIAKKNPFSNFTKNFKEYIKALKTKKQVDKDLATAQDTYTKDMDELVRLKEQLEQAKDAGDKDAVLNLQMQIGLQQKIVDKSKKSYENAQKASQAIKGTLKSFANQLSSISNTFSNISNAVNLVRDDLSDLGVDLGEQVNGIIDGFSQASEGFSDMVQSATSGDIFGVVANGIHSLIGQGKMLVSLFGGRLSPSDYITPLITKLQGLMDTLDAVNEKQAKYLDSLAGPAAVAKYRELIKNNDKQIENYRRLAKAAGESGASIGSHSWAYRSNKRLKGQWAEISKYAGATLRSVQDMYSLDASQLEAIMINAPEQWSKIDADIRSYFEKIIEYGEKAEEYTKKLGEALTSISSESVASDFENMLRDMTSSTADFADNVEEMLRNAIIRSMMADTYNEELQKWHDRFTAAMGDGELSDEEARNLHDEYMKIVNSALKDREELMKVVPDSASSLSALQQGIQGITEDTAGALESYMNGVSQQVYAHTDLLTQIRDAVVGFDMDIQSATLSQMLMQLQNSYQTQQAIQSILEGWTNASGMAVRVEMV